MRESNGTPADSGEHGSRRRVTACLDTDRRGAHALRGTGPGTGRSGRCVPVRVSHLPWVSIHAPLRLPVVIEGLLGCLLGHRSSAPASLRTCGPRRWECSWRALRPALPSRGTPTPPSRPSRARAQSPARRARPAMRWPSPGGEGDPATATRPNGHGWVRRTGSSGWRPDEAGDPRHDHLDPPPDSAPWNRLRKGRAKRRRHGPATRWMAKVLAGSGDWPRGPAAHRAYSVVCVG